MRREESVASISKALKRAEKLFVGEPAKARDAQPVTLHRALGPRLRKPAKGERETKEAYVFDLAYLRYPKKNT